MQNRHMSIETLARLLAGDLDHESLTRQVIPHLLECCPNCRKRYQEILELQKEVGHWDERVAVFEGRQAPELYALLEPLGFDEQLGRVLDDDNFQTWGLCQLLLKKSLEQVHAEPSCAVQLAELAVRIAERLGDAYDPHWVLDLRARAHSYLGNARRVLGELHSAEVAFLEAERIGAASLTGNGQIQAEQLDLKASLRRDQRKLGEALKLIQQAISAYQELGLPEAVVGAQIKKAQILEESGELVAALETLQAAEASLQDPGSLPLRHWVSQNLLFCLVELGRFEEAETLFQKVKEQSRQVGRALDQIKLRWVQGRILVGLGQIEAAEDAFREVHLQFVQRGMSYDAALALLDHAVLLAESGRLEELKTTASELRSTFETLSISREALAAVLLFEQACREERVTAQLTRQLIDLFGKGRREHPEIQIPPP